MNPRRSSITLALLIILGASLAILSVQAHATKTLLRQAIDSTQVDLAQISRQSVNEKNQLADLNAAVAGQQRTLDSSPGSLEAMRRTSAMTVIETIKAAHEKNPPPPKQKMPPSGPSGWFFPELLSDPEYSRLYAEQQRKMIKRSEGAKLRNLGLTEEAIDKVAAVMAEQRVTLADYRAVSGKAGIPREFAKQQEEASNNQLKEIMGEAVFARWKKLDEVETVFVPSPTGTGMRGYAVRPHEALVEDAKGMFIPRLETRLSYSEMPLGKDQADQLAEILANCSTGPGNHVYKAMYTDAFIQQAAQVLSATQMEALKQFKAEHDASTKRSELPKSSELPRNTQ